MNESSAVLKKISYFSDIGILVMLFKTGQKNMILQASILSYGLLFFFHCVLRERSLPRSRFYGARITGNTSPLKTTAWEAKS